MKPFKALVLASLVLGACEKTDNLTQLHQQAIDTAKYYAPRVDEMVKRRDSIFQRGRNVPGNLPDVPQIVRLIGEAGDKITEMKGITGGLEKQADDVAKTNKVEDLAKLVDESNEKLDDDWTVANDDLTSVESWLWQYEQNRGTLPPPPVAPPTPTPNDIGEPPPAAAGSGAGSAAPADNKTEKATDNKTEKATDKKTEKATDKKTEKATEKAAKKAATEKVDTKTGQPKTERGPATAASPKPPTPKAAGSGAK